MTLLIFRISTEISSIPVDRHIKQFCAVNYENLEQIEGNLITNKFCYSKLIQTPQNLQKP